MFNLVPVVHQNRMRCSQQRLILAHWNPLTGPVAILYLPPFLTVRSNHMTKFSLKEQEQKRKSMPLLVRCIRTLHMSSSMLFLLPPGGRSNASETIQYGGASHKMERSGLLSDCVKGSLPTSLSEQSCEQEINFYCVNLLIIWNLLVTTAYLTLTNTEKNAVSWSVL